MHTAKICHVHSLKIFLKKVWQNAKLECDSLMTDLSNKRDNSGNNTSTYGAKISNGLSDLTTQGRV